MCSSDLAPLASLGVHPGLKVKYSQFELPPKRQAGIKVKDVAELVTQLQTNAKAL